MSGHIEEQCDPPTAKKGKSGQVWVCTCDKVWVCRSLMGWDSVRWVWEPMYFVRGEKP